MEKRGYGGAREVSFHSNTVSGSWILLESCTYLIYCYQDPEEAEIYSASVVMEAFTNDF